MGVLFVNGLLMLGLVVATVPDAMVLGSSGPTLVMEQDIPSRTCRYSRPYSMLQVRCSNLDLREIPTTLKTDIQILDVSVNRLRELRNDSLSLYKNLAFLYLGDNFIQYIEEAAFTGLSYLEVLDLSTNGCDDLPRSLFQLPYLRKLYLCGNKLTDDLFGRLDVKSPLNFLQLAKNRLLKIPQLDPVPNLAHLNLSDNSIAAVSPEELAPFCSLKTLDLSRNPIKFNSDACECHALNAWFDARGIRALPQFNCTEELEKGCSPKLEMSNRTSELYERCTNILQLRIETEKARTTWILVACCISVFLFCLFVSLFCVHKRNKRRKKKLKEEQRLNANNANTELLNSNLSRPENT